MYIGSTGPGAAPPRLRGRRQLDRRSAGRVLRSGQRHDPHRQLRSPSSTTAAVFPVDSQHESGSLAAEVVTVLHAGGKFDHNSYKVSGGLHGVGVSVVNALSERLDLEIWRATARSTNRATNEATPTADRSKSPARPSAAAHKGHVQARTLSSSRRPSSASIAHSRSVCASWPSLEHGGIVITLDDERDGKNHKFQYEGGIVSFVTHLRITNKAVNNESRSTCAGPEGRQRPDRPAVERRAYRARSAFVREQHQHARGGTRCLSGFKSPLSAHDVACAVTKGCLCERTERACPAAPSARADLAVVSVKAIRSSRGQTKTKLEHQGQGIDWKRFSTTSSGPTSREPIGRPKRIIQRRPSTARRAL